MHALTAVLVWLKIFSFFSYFPSMQILTRTLAYAAAPLASFSIIFVIVLVGFGQAFFLAFSLDIKEYRTLFTSFFALLRMAVGDFDYEGLEQSHNMLGPSLFWMCKTRSSDAFSICRTSISLTRKVSLLQTFSSFSSS